MNEPANRAGLPGGVQALALLRGRAGAAASDGTARALTREEAVRLLAGGHVLLAHPALTASRLGARRSAPPLFDLCELYAFVRPARAFLPTAEGMAQALGLPLPGDAAEAAACLIAAAGRLLDEAGAWTGDTREEAARAAEAMERAGWVWAPLILARTGRPQRMGAGGGLGVWAHLPQWEEAPLPPPPPSRPVSEAEARARLAELTGADAEARPAQGDYAALATRAFAPRERVAEPHVVLAEAGTGLGKTAGYLAAATLWAEKNGAPVIVSTFTRNLQRQIDQELTRRFPDPAEKAERVVIRKGRENYLCLLNLQEAAQRLAVMRPGDAILLGLVARWAGATRDGDLLSGDFPTFLAPQAMLSPLTDRRGECVYAACPHYRTCFVERSVRRARKAAIVVANHALVLTQAARSDHVRGGSAAEDEDGPPIASRPLRFVFDEGHHLFEAADSAFAMAISGRECADLRRWIRGPEGGRGRGRGLAERYGDLAADDAARAAIAEAGSAAGVLPGAGWAGRLSDGAPRGPAETFLGHVRAQVLARAEDHRSPYDIEADIHPPADGLIAAAAAFDTGLDRLARALGRLADLLANRLQAEAETLDSATRLRIEAAVRALDRRAHLILPGWRAMLAALDGEPAPGICDHFVVERDEGRERDTAFRRHFVDPTKPLAALVFEPAHGALVTSATLRDAGLAAETPELDWQAAELRTGAAHLMVPAQRASFPSPFDYAAQTRALVVTDLDTRDMGALAEALRALFVAAGGGALGLFTAIRTLRAVHGPLSDGLANAGLPLYAQHADPIDTASLVDLFRAEAESCLIGTDALRDGVDVPGRALRLVVMDRIPWPRRSILFRERRAAFGPAYEDMIVRLRLRQAFGRLIRRADDRGVFVMLDRRAPSRLMSVLPVPPERVGLADAIAIVRETVKDGHPAPALPRAAADA